MDQSASPRIRFPPGRRRQCSTSICIAFGRRQDGIGGCGIGALHQSRAFEPARLPDGSPRTGACPGWSRECAFAVIGVGHRQRLIAVRGDDDVIPTVASAATVMDDNAVRSTDVTARPSLSRSRKAAVIFSTCRLAHRGALCRASKDVEDPPKLQSATPERAAAT